MLGMQSGRPDAAAIDYGVAGRRASPSKVIGSPNTRLLPSSIPRQLATSP